MLSRVELVLDINPQQTDYNTASVFHGLIMENIQKDYVQKMHNSDFNPFSQCIFKSDKGEIIWRINTLNEEAYENIILPFYEKLDSFFIKHRSQKINVLNKTIEHLSYNELIRKYYSNQIDQRVYKIRLISPMAFKVKGEYKIFPDLYILYRNLMNKFDAFSSDYKLFDKEALEHLNMNSHIRDYKLKTTRFHVEKTKIPGILGDLVVSIDGSLIMKSLAGLLFYYAQYSGIGIKTSLGMGGCEKIK